MWVLQHRLARKGQMCREEKDPSEDLKEISCIFMFWGNKKKRGDFQIVFQSYLFVCLFIYLFIVNECIGIHCERQFEGAGNLLVIPASEQMQKRQLESGCRSDFACCFWHLLISVHVAVALELCMGFPCFSVLLCLLLSLYLRLC